MAVNKLSVYNNALYVLGERRLASEYEDREPRYVLDEVVGLDNYGAILELTKPHFAVRSAKLSGPVVSAVHSLDQVYTFPVDYLSPLGGEGVHGQNCSFFSDEDFNDPIDRYIIEGRTVACDVATNIFVRYISKTPSFEEWTPLFAKLASAYLAREAASRLNPSRLDYANAQFGQLTELVRSLEGTKENPILPQKQTAPLTADELDLYNMVAANLGRAEFRYVSDESGLRLAIDGVYNLQRDRTLSLIKPRFSTKVAALTGGTTSATHGFDNVFALPAGFVDIVTLFADDTLEQPIHQYIVEDNDIAVENYAAPFMRYIDNSLTADSFSPNYRIALALHIATALAPRFAPDMIKALTQLTDQATGIAATLEGFKETARPQRATFTLTEDYRDLYNKALEILELDPIVSISDDSERKVKLDYALNNQAVETVFELVSWGFLYKTVKLEKDAVADRAFGHRYTFTVPADMIRIDMISADEYFRYPLDYVRELEEFFCDVTEFYLRYLSDAQVSTPTTWPVYVYNLVAAELAKRCSGLPGANREQAFLRYDEYKGEAYSTDAQRNPPQVISEGSWVRSRNMGQSRRTERP